MIFCGQAFFVYVFPLCQRCNTASNYFIQKGRQNYGPMPGPDVTTLAQSGKLMPNDLVWKEGSESKVRARLVKGTATLVGARHFMDG